MNTLGPTRSHWPTLSSGWLARYVRRHIDEIHRDSALQLYGSALALVNALTAYYWLLSKPASAIIGRPSPAICWPFFENCGVFRLLSEAQVVALLVLLLVASLACSWVFVSPSRTAVGYWLLLATTLLKTAILLQDYRLAMNQHYVALTVALPFLFVPHKRLTLRYLIVLVYFWAGTLKLNSDWLSGAALLGARPLGVPPALVSAACQYVIVLETIGSFWLLARRAPLFWLTLIQFAVFHVSSFAIVGYYYPLLMFLVLSIFPATALLEPPSPRVVGRAMAAPRRGGKATVVTAALFSMLQCVPHAIPGDAAITGEGRLVALNMFDAPVQCRAEIALWRDSGQVEPLRARPPYLEPRIGCDPIVYRAVAREYCAVLVGTKDGAEISLRLESRRGPTGVMQAVIDVPAFCSAELEYSIWRHNDWILLW